MNLQNLGISPDLEEETPEETPEETSGESLPPLSNRAAADAYEGKPDYSKYPLPKILVGPDAIASGNPGRNPFPGTRAPNVSPNANSRLVTDLDQQALNEEPGQVPGASAAMADLPWGAAGGFNATGAQQMVHQAYLRGTTIDKDILDQAYRDRQAQNTGVPRDASLSEGQMNELWRRAVNTVRLPPGELRNRTIASTFQHLMSEHARLNQHAIDIEMRGKESREIRKAALEETKRKNAAAEQDRKDKLAAAQEKQKADAAAKNEAAKKEYTAMVNKNLDRMHTRASDMMKGGDISWQNLPEELRDEKLMRRKAEDQALEDLRVVHPKMADELQAAKTKKEQEDQAREAKRATVQAERGMKEITGKFGATDKGVPDLNSATEQQLVELQEYMDKHALNLGDPKKVQKAMDNVSEALAKKRKEAAALRGFGKSTTQQNLQETARDVQSSTLRGGPFGGVAGGSEPMFTVP